MSIHRQSNKWRNIFGFSRTYKGDSVGIFTARKRSCGKVMFLHLCVILFTIGVGFLACITGHMTSIQWGLPAAGGGGLHPGGLSTGVLHPGGLGRLPQELWKQAVRILLECFLVIQLSSARLWVGRPRSPCQTLDPQLITMLKFSLSTNSPPQLTQNIRT